MNMFYLPIYLGCLFISFIRVFFFLSLQHLYFVRFMQHIFGGKIIVNDKFFNFLVLNWSLLVYGNATNFCVLTPQAYMHSLACTLIHTGRPCGHAHTHTEAHSPLCTHTPLALATACLVIPR